MANETTVGGIPIARLKEALKAADDNQLATFLRGWALGFAAEQFIANMSMPDERVGFLVSMAGQYPADWARTLEILKKATEAK